MSGALALQPQQHFFERAAGSAAGHLPRRKSERNVRPTEIRSARQKVSGSAAKVRAAARWYRRVIGALVLQPQQHLFKRAAVSAAGHLPRRKSERNARPTEIRSACQQMSGSAAKVRAAARWYRRLSEALALQPQQYLFERAAGIAAGNLRGEKESETRDQQRFGARAKKLPGVQRKCVQRRSGTED